METNGQSSGPDRWFPGHRASSYTYFPWDRLHEQYGPFLRGSKTRFEAVVSSSFSCFQISLRTPSLASYPNTRRRGEPGEVYQQCQTGRRAGITTNIARTDLMEPAAWEHELAVNLDGP